MAAGRGSSNRHRRSTGAVEGVRRRVQKPYGVALTRRAPVLRITEQLLNHPPHPVGPSRQGLHTRRPLPLHWRQREPTPFPPVAPKTDLEDPPLRIEENTPKGKVRHAVFVALREGKPAAGISLESDKLEPWCRASTATTNLCPHPALAIIAPFILGLFRSTRLVTLRLLQDCRHPGQW